MQRKNILIFQWEKNIDIITKKQMIIDEKQQESDNGFQAANILHNI